MDVLGVISLAITALGGFATAIWAAINVVKKANHEELVNTQKRLDEVEEREAKCAKHVEKLIEEKNKLREDIGKLNGQYTEVSYRLTVITKQLGISIASGVADKIEEVKATVERVAADQTDRLEAKIDEGGIKPGEAQQEATLQLHVPAQALEVKQKE